MTRFGGTGVNIRTYASLKLGKSRKGQDQVSEMVSVLWCKRPFETSQNW